MKKEIKTPSNPVEYFRLERTDRNLFRVDVIVVQDGKIIDQKLDEPAHLPIAFDQMKRRTANSYFAVVNENSK